MKPFNSRREFVKQSSLIAGGMVVLPKLAGANFYSGADDVIKIALIGCGGRGTGAAMQALQSKQNVKLVAMADAFQDRLDRCYTTITSDDMADAGAKVDLKKMIDVPAERRFVGFDAYQKAIPLADVVILATPPGFRPIHFEEAVKQGKHVFMEKPVATDPAGVQKVLAAAQVAKQKKLNVVVGLQRHYQNSYRELFKRKALIGDIVSAQAWWNNDGVWVNPRKPGQTEMEYQMRNWYYFNWLCGDHINEQHIHNIDVVNWFKGGYPVKAQGMGGREVRKGKDHGEIFDHHFVEFHYADGSILNSQCRHQPKTMAKVDELLVGTKGRIQCGDANIVDGKGKVLYQFDKKSENNPYQTEHDELFAAIAKGEYKYSDAENGAYSTMTSILGRMATYSGQVVEWDKALNSGISLQPKVYAWDAQAPVLPNADGYYPVGGPGEDKFLNSGSGSKKILVYDVNFEANRFEGDTAIFAKKVSSNPQQNLYNRLFYKYDYINPGLSVGYNIDDGIFLGGRLEVLKQGFRKEPYASRHLIVAKRALKTGSTQFRWESDFTGVWHGTDLLIRADVRAPVNVTNFFGIGNNTRFDKAQPGRERFYRVRYDYADASVLFRKQLQSWMRVFYGPSFQYFSLDRGDNEGHFVTGYFPGSGSDLYQRHLYAGAQVGFDINSKNNRVIPTRGLQFNMQARPLFGLNSWSNNLVQFSGDMRIFASFEPQARLVYAFRLGGGFNAGKYAFQQANYLSGTENLRGYRRDRFAGRSMLYNNIELRLKIADFNTYLFPGQIGVLAFNDVGRVWAKEESSARWHVGNGLGVYISPVKRWVVTGMVTRSKEEKLLPMVVFGFFF